MAATNQSARHAEIARRYSWASRQRKNGEPKKKPDHARLITMIRLRELERIFQSRYGRFLPDDDSGRDDLNLVAHHIAHLGGDIAAHVLGWAKAWAPWMPEADAITMAEQVAADPVKYTADVLAWRLRLSAGERAALGITTIGAFDRSRADRIEERKLKDRERKRAKRAANSSGRPRGRPRKMRPQQVEPIAADAISDQVPSSTEPVATTTPAKAAVTPFTPQIGLKRDEDAVLVANSSQMRRSFKTRFPTTLRLNDEMHACAIEAGFTATQTERMFDIFREHNVAQRTYSANWTETWFAWVNREVDIVMARQDRQRRQSYYEHRT